MSFGPVLKWDGETVKIFNSPIPLPYSGLYYTVPGFKGVRAVERWVYPAFLMITALSIYGISQFSTKRIILVVVVVLVGWGELRPLPAVWAPSRSDYPKVYWWLKDQPEGVVMELPISRWGEGELTKLQIYAMLYQTLHEKTLVNGYSGYSPLDWEDLVRKMRVSDLSLLDTVEQIQPKYLVLNKSFKWNTIQSDVKDSYVQGYEDDTVIVLVRE